MTQSAVSHLSGLVNSIAAHSSLSQLSVSPPFMFLTADTAAALLIGHNVQATKLSLETHFGRKPSVL